MVVVADAVEEYELFVVEDASYSYHWRKNKALPFHFDLPVVQVEQVVVVVEDVVKACLYYYYYYYSSQVVHIVVVEKSSIV